MKPDYKTYINSQEWKAKARAVKFFAGYRCQLCGKAGNDSTLHAHHNTYDRLGNENFTDLVCLCEGCHSRHHGQDLTSIVITAVLGDNVDMDRLWPVLRDRHLNDFVAGLETYPEAVKRWIGILGLTSDEYNLDIRW